MAQAVTSAVKTAPSRKTPHRPNFSRADRLVSTGSRVAHRPSRPQRVEPDDKREQQPGRRQVDGQRQGKQGSAEQRFEQLRGEAPA